MKTHLKHRFSKTAHLELVEYSSTLFMVEYLTMEGTDEEGREMWYGNNSNDFNNYNDALACFNKRRVSDDPWSKMAV